MLSIFKGKRLSSTESVDIIENIVYETLKPIGFRKHGRTLHRFVNGDISQVINFQNGCPQKGVYGILWVNIGIRVPECVERKFDISEPMKNYYHEYECNIRTRLGSLVDGEDTFYDLKKHPQKIAKDIIDRLKKHVIPVFDVLNSRESIVEHRAEYPSFDLFANHLILLEEAMIFGRIGDIEKSSDLYNKHYKYYQKSLGANRGHLSYLETLAEQLGIVLDDTDKDKKSKSLNEIILDAEMTRSTKTASKKNSTASDNGYTPGGRAERPHYIPDKER